MAKVYIRGVTITPYNTLNLAATANDYITNALVPASAAGGGLTQIDDIDFEFYNNVMFVIVKDLS